MTLVKKQSAQKLPSLVKEGMPWPTATAGVVRRCGRT